MTYSPRIAVFEGPFEGIDQVVRDAGGMVVDLDAAPEGLVWAGSPQELKALLAATPSVRWVQLTAAGVDGFQAAGALTEGILWTCAKGSYARPVAEHALALILGALRVLPVRARATQWGEQLGETLYGARVVVVGAGGIATELLRLMESFHVDVCVVRRTAEPLAAYRTVPTDQLRDVLPWADVVVLAAAHTASTEHLLGARELAAMKKSAVLVNIARGALIDTGALLRELEQGSFHGVGLDVTDPEPLPIGHPLWSIDRVLVTPHTADTIPLMQPLLATRVTENVKRYRENRPLVGTVDIAAGY